MGQRGGQGRAEEGRGPRSPSLSHSPAGRAQRGPPGARLPLARGAGAPSRAGRPRPGPGRAPPAPSSCRCLACLRRRLPGPGPAGRAERRRVPRAACCCAPAATRGADKPAAAPPPAEPPLHVRHGPARRGTAGEPARLRAQTHRGTNPIAVLPLHPRRSPPLLPAPEIHRETFLAGRPSIHQSHAPSLLHHTLVGAPRAAPQPGTTSSSFHISH